MNLGPFDHQLFRLRIECVTLASGLEGVTVVDAWDSVGVREERFVEPIGISMALAVSPTVSLGSSLGGNNVCFCCHRDAEKCDGN